MANLVRNIFNFSLQSSKTIIFRCRQPSRMLAAKKEASSDEEDLDKPVRYSTSKAAAWKAEYSFSGTSKEDVSPWYEPYVVSLSVAVFLIYFAILREENDIDEQLGMSLYDRVDGLEEVQLKSAIAYYKEHEKGRDVSAMEQRLAEIQALKRKN